ncbi:MAG: peptide-methionine (S)-S-oxide reductase MsrA [Fusicatenibacter sp.]|nr:peptide-methionine (S)-S-oxide reductase MsrA [Fusicatenibacter sp.]
METKVIYLAGGCYWGVEKYMSSVKGVTKTTVGFANGKTEAPTYEQVLHEDTGYAETVRVEYAPEAIALPVLLQLFYKIIDPAAGLPEGEETGYQYRNGVYYTSEEDEKVVLASREKLEKTSEKALTMETCPLEKFWPAEEYHQKYLDKNPTGYCHVPLPMIQWIKTVDPKDYPVE